MSVRQGLEFRHIPSVLNELLPVIWPLTISGYPEPHCTRGSRTQPFSRLRDSGLLRPVGPRLPNTTSILPYVEDSFPAHNVVIICPHVVILLMGPWAFPLSKTPRCLPFHRCGQTGHLSSLQCSSNFWLQGSLCTQEFATWQFLFLSECLKREIWLLLVTWPRIGSLACSHGPCSGELPGTPMGIQQIMQVIRKQGIYWNPWRVNKGFYPPQAEKKATIQRATLSITSRN